MNFYLLRNKKDLLVIISIFTILLIFILLIVVLSKKSERYERLIRQNELAEIKSIQREFIETKNRIERIEERVKTAKKDVSLISFLDTYASKTGIKGKIIYMKPQSNPIFGPYRESVVEVRIEKISLNQFINFLYLIENLDVIMGVKKVEIKSRFDNPSLLDVNFQIFTFESS